MSDLANDFIGLGIEKARLKFIWHLGGEIIGEIRPTVNVCDGLWHSVAIARHEKSVTLFLDGVAFKSVTKGAFTQLNAPNKIYLGKEITLIKINSFTHIFCRRIS